MYENIAQKKHGRATLAIQWYSISELGTMPSGEVEILRFWKPTCNIGRRAADESVSVPKAPEPDDTIILSMPYTNTTNYV
jgi:hypothetical protein